jgi:hypothetical protein
MVLGGFPIYILPWSAFTSSVEGEAMFVCHSENMLYCWYLHYPVGVPVTDDIECMCELYLLQ